MRLPNYLFLKLLLAFWLTSSLVVGLVIGLPYLQRALDRQALQPLQAEMLEKAAERMQGQPPRQLARWLQRHHHREPDRPHRFFLVDENGQSISPAPPLSRNIRRFLLDLPDMDTPQQRQFRKHLVFGPMPLQLEGQTAYLVMERRGKARHHWISLLLDRPGFLLLSAITFSGLVFGLLAWHLGKPLRQLEDTASRLARGDLAARVDADTGARRDELGQLARHFNAMADALNGMLAGQRRLLSDISHELRTPLTRLQLALALARKRQGDGPALQRIGREADQLDAMMGELLALARLENQWDQPMVETDLAQCLEEVVDNAHFEAEQLGKALQVDLPKGLMLPMRPAQCQRAVENVLRNALKYADNEISLVASAEPEGITLTIRDDGPGVPDDQLEALFKPFYRVDDARSRDQGGWGLGLAITQAAVTQHRGQVTAQANVPQGLAVRIRLPR